MGCETMRIFAFNTSLYYTLLVKLKIRPAAPPGFKPATCLLGRC